MTENVGDGMDRELEIGNGGGDGVRHPKADLFGIGNGESDSDDTARS